MKVKQMKLCCNLLIVEVMFSQSNYVISEKTGLLFLAVKLSQPSQVAFEITVSLRNATNTGVVT